MATDWTSIESVQKLALQQEQQLGPQHAQLADTLSALGDLFFVAEDFAGAEQHYWRVLGIRQKVLGEHHADTAAALQNLAELYEIQDRYAEAQRFYQWATAVRKMAKLKAHSDTLDRTEQIHRPPVLPQLTELKKKCPVCNKQLLDADVCMYCTQQGNLRVQELLAGAVKQLPAAQSAKPNGKSGPVNALVREDSNDTYMLDDTELTIGRHPNNGIVIMADKAVSRKHARICYDAGHFYIRDCDSINGTFVNSQRITQPTRLAQGDVVSIGNIKLKATFLQAQC